MDRVTLKRFDIGQQIDTVEVEAEGNKWLMYWLVGEDEAFSYMTDGARFVQIRNPHEWQDVYADAIVLTADPARATDLTCERMKHVMQQRGEWKPLA